MAWTEAEWRRAAEAAKAKRLDQALAQLPPMDFAAIARGTSGIEHSAQRRFMEATGRYLALMCSRRAGKTVGIGGRYAKRSVATPGGNRVYIALTKDQSREIMWEPIWKPLCAKWRLCKAKDHDETRMITEFPNGSRVRFTGSDDIRHIETELGGAVDEATLDESQSQPDLVLRTLTEKILPPALGDRLGTLILSGVVPDVAAGFYWDTWQRALEAPGVWETFNFSMFDNPHFSDPQRVVDEYLAAHPGMTIEDPLVQRDYYGRFKHDPNVTAYRYSRELNGYTQSVPAWLEDERAALEEAGVPIESLLAAEPMPGVRHFSAAIDPGSIDRAAVEVLGWGTDSHEVQQVFEWSTPRRSNPSWEKIKLACKVAAHHYNIAWWHYDTTSKNEMELFTRDHGIVVIKAANKADMPGQVRRNSDLLLQGRMKVMIDSALEEDYMKSRLDPDARARGQWKWASQHHPDPSEAARYALAPYFDTWRPPKTVTIFDNPILKRMLVDPRADKANYR